MLAKALYTKISIIGGGLMGCSLAHALKDRQVASEILLLVHKAEAKEKIIARDLKATTRYDDLLDSDIIFIATPLSAYQDIFIKLDNLVLKKGVIITDLGSVKSCIKDLANRHMPSKNFVAAHPIAGSEKSGTGMLITELYQNKKVIITEDPNDYTKKIERIWQEIGAKTEYIEAKLHDKIYGYISHLVQNIAFNLNYVFHHSRRDLLALNKDYADEDFKKFTRLYFSNKSMWQDIFIFNELVLKEAMANAQAELQKLVVNIDQLIIEQNTQEVSKLETKDLDLRIASMLANLVKEIIKNNVENYQRYAGSGFNDFTKIANNKKVNFTDLTVGDLGYIRDRLANLLNYLY